MQRLPMNAPSSTMFGRAPGGSARSEHAQVPVPDQSHRRRVHADPHLQGGVPLEHELEERDPEEVLGLQFHGERVAPVGSKARNPSFDITSNRLISAIVTEKGVIYPPFEENIKEIFI